MPNQLTCKVISHLLILTWKKSDFIKDNSNEKQDSLPIFTSQQFFWNLFQFFILWACDFAYLKIPHCKCCLNKRSIFSSHLSILWAEMIWKLLPNYRVQKTQPDFCNIFTPELLFFASICNKLRVAEFAKIKRQSITDLSVGRKCVRLLTLSVYNVQKKLQISTCFSNIYKFWWNQPQGFLFTFFKLSEMFQLDLLNSFNKSLCIISH